MSKIYPIIFLIILATFLSSGCDDNRSGIVSGVPEPVPGFATRILLTVYPVGTGEPPQEITIRSEGDVYIDLGDSVIATNYYIYAETVNRYYTELYYCNKGGTITVDLDSVAGPLRTMAGTIFAKQSFWSDSYLYDKTMTLRGPKNITRTVITDDQGRYSIGVLPLGDYTLEFTAHGEPIVLNLNNSATLDYKDLSFFEPTQVDAPNIYLYPETESDISVSLDFPNGGHVNVSDPPYNDGWNVNVTPEGIIDGEYDYLFYKAILPTQPNTNEGWLLTTANLEAEFRTILAEQGFAGREGSESSPAVQMVISNKTPEGCSLERGIHLIPQRTQHPAETYHNKERHQKSVPSALQNHQSPCLQIPAQLKSS